MYEYLKLNIRYTLYIYIIKPIVNMLYFLVGLNINQHQRNNMQATE